MVSEKSEVPKAASLRPELDLPSRPSQFLAAAGEAAPRRWRVSLRPRLTSRRRPGVESALNKILAQLRVPRWVKGLVPVGALGLARSWQPVHRLWRPLPSERNTIKRVRAGKAIDSYSWLHPLTTPYPHPDSREPSTAQVSFDLPSSQLKGSARIFNRLSQGAEEDTEARRTKLIKGSLIA